MISAIHEKLDWKDYLYHDQGSFNEMKVFAKIIHDYQALGILQNAFFI